MRIAYDYQAFTLQSYGGISRYFACLAQGLMNLQHQVKIIAPLHRNSYLGLLPPGIVDGRGITKFPPKTARLFIAYNYLATRLKIAQWQPDVVHETYYSRVGSAPKNCPTVITVYDMIHELYRNEFPAHDNTSALKIKAIQRADHVICISENTKQDLMRLHGTDANKISVVHLGFTKFGDKGKISPPAELNRKPFILYVGNREGYKNFSGLIKAVALSKKLVNDFDIIAFGGGQLTSAESSLIQSSGFAPEQVRQVSGDDILLGQYYEAARAFVYPSLYEGFGIPPLEAMAHRCPVISSNTSSMPEVIGNAAEFFDPSQAQSVCLAIENVVYSDARSAELRHLGHHRLKAFTWKKCTAQTLVVYRAVLGQSK